MLQVDMTGKYMYRQVDMTKKANWYDKVGKLIWQHVKMTTQCNQLVASQLARQLGNYNCLQEV